MVKAIEEERGFSSLSSSISQSLPSPTTAARWDDAFERARLDAAYDWCDGAARERGRCWAECWSWARHRRPDLAELIDDALDAIDAAHKAKDVAAHIAACALLRGAVAAIVDVAPIRVPSADDRRPEQGLQH